MTCPDRSPPPAPAGEAPGVSIQDLHKPDPTDRIVVILSEIREGRPIPAF
jgi:hypothetical protein